MRSREPRHSIIADATLYPDASAPAELTDTATQVDFLARLCSAWDFGILPNPAVARELHHPDWREAVDRCRLLTSPAYHLLRRWHGLPRLPYLGQRLAYIAEDEQLAHV